VEGRKTVYRLYKQNFFAEWEYVGSYTVPELLLVILSLLTERKPILVEPQG